MLKEKVINSIDTEKIKYSFVVKNLKTDNYYSYNENKVVPSASLIKIPIMAEVLNQVKKGELSLEQKIIINEDEKVEFSIITLLDKKEYSLLDIIKLMIVYSDNTATNILIDLVGMDNVNRLIEDIGLKNTIINRKMMDFKARKEGKENYTNASDMEKLLKYLYDGKLIDKYFSDLMIEIMIKQTDQSMMASFIPDEVKIARKTGELENLDHDIGIVYYKDREYIFVALTWNAVSNNYARDTLGRISKITFDYLGK
ncbi:MAG: serine hydrolase [Firmicutes bacterium]|nr:serine hydrolase [Bacillota bacterium]